jgi:hypothetical protein
MFEDAAPGLREAQQPLVAGSPEDGSGKEHGGPDGGGFAVAKRRRESNDPLWWRPGKTGGCERIDR